MTQLRAEELERHLGFHVVQPRKHRAHAGPVVGHVRRADRVSDVHPVRASLVDLLGGLQVGDPIRQGQLNRPAVLVLQDPHQVQHGTTAARTQVEDPAT